MLFGLFNGPASFEHYINIVLFRFLDKFCTAYLDNILVYSENLQEELMDGYRVLESLLEAGLQVDVTEFEFHVQKVTFLSVIVSIQGLKMDLSKVAAIID